jgi:hypothetical protein
MDYDFPKNIHKWFISDTNPDFSMWAFGCLQPGSSQKLIECWEKLHPEHKIKDNDSMFIIICKMNYIYQKEIKNGL